MISVVTRPVAASHVRTDHTRHTVGRDDVEASERNPAPLVRSAFLASIPPAWVHRDEASLNASQPYGTIRGRTSRATLSILAYTPRDISSGTAPRQRTRTSLGLGNHSRVNANGSATRPLCAARRAHPHRRVLASAPRVQGKLQLRWSTSGRPGPGARQQRGNAPLGADCGSPPPILAASPMNDHHRSAAEVRVADEQAGVAMRQLYRGVRASFGGVACRLRGARASFDRVTPCGTSSSTSSEEEKV